jgi:hypothetical protein
MANVYLGNSKALVFPVMSDGYLKIPYADSNISTSKGNLWNLSEGFVIEALITPYDVNGNATDEVLTSTKTVPIGTTNSTQSGTYFGTGRHSHKMMLFYNTKFQLYLENTTVHNKNQPAEYRIGVGVDGLSSDITTPTLIRPVNTLHGYYDENGYYNDMSTSLTLLQADSTVSGNTITLTSSNVSKLATGSEIFNANGVSLGTVTIASSTTITVADASNHTAKIYVSQPKEAFYVEQIYKITCVYHYGGSIQIMLNNQQIGRYDAPASFSFNASDCFIGKDGTNKNTQFMGELYEIALYKGSKASPTLVTLTPSYSSIMFYYRFGD